MSFSRRSTVNFTSDTQFIKDNALGVNQQQATTIKRVTMTRILLAEDEQAMREYLTRALEKSGYEVVAVDRGTEAAPLLEAEHFDLLLTDIVMPEMDGIELARHCAKVSPKSEVMFITGFSGVALRAGESMPQAKILSKPFHLKDLVLEVERLFNKEAATGAI
jgi:two-component system, cell cycle response regulator CpdR